MEVDANSQALINVARYRLCYCAHPEARVQMEDLKREIHKDEPQIADVMQKNCVYRCGCPEFKPCGYWDGFMKRNQGVNLCNIKERYQAANNEFYGGNHA
jgi:thymidylate synthase ThyX